MTKTKLGGITLVGPTLRFNCDSIIAICGALVDAWLDGEPLAQWRAHVVKAGAVVQLGKIEITVSLLPGSARRFQSSRLSRQQVHFHPWSVWWAWGASASDWGRAAYCRNGVASRRDVRLRCRMNSFPITAACGKSTCCMVHMVRLIFLPMKIYNFFHRRLESALQLQPQRRAPDRSETAVVTERRRRGGVASVEYT